MTMIRAGIAAVAGCITLTTSLALAPATIAQDTPESTIQSFVNAVAARDYEALPTYFCEDQVEQAAQFDPSNLASMLPEMAGMMPDGVDLESLLGAFDVQQLLDAFVFDIQLNGLETLSESEAEAVVHVAGTIAMDVDPEALAEFFAGIFGDEFDDSAVELFFGPALADLGSQTEDIDADITLVSNDEGQWQICSDLSFGESALMGEEASAAPAAVDDGMTDDGLAVEASASPAAGE